MQTPKDEPPVHDWIKDSVVKRCGRHYKWFDGSLMVAVSNEDGKWYTIEEDYTQVSAEKTDEQWQFGEPAYKQGLVIQGEWPQKDGLDKPQGEVALKSSVEDGVCVLSFAEQEFG